MSKQHAVDIEATVRNGALDVGVFAPCAMMDVEGAEKVVEGVRRGFESLVGLE